MPVNAIDLLVRDHREIKRLLKELEAKGARVSKARQELFGQVKAELTVHEIIEEEIFYPALRQHPKAKDIVLEGIEEHNVVDTLMGELTALPPEDERWHAKVTVMKESVEHHIEEEEGEMFKQARKVFDEAELDDLGRAMEERQREARAASRG